MWGVQNLVCPPPKTHRHGGFWGGGLAYKYIVCIALQARRPWLPMRRKSCILAPTYSSVHLLRLPPCNISLQCLRCDHQGTVTTKGGTGVTGRSSNSNNNNNNNNQQRTNAVLLNLKRLGQVWQTKSVHCHSR